jgi:PAS domain S-box-containing protein
VAEDNQVNQLVATRIFEKLGHQATVVSNGREAFAAYQAGKFDLIAMDVQMPEMDGLDATSAIRAWEKTAGTHTPIIAMTAHAMKGDRERCLAAGMDGYTSKPIRIGELEHAIAQLISPPNSAKVPVSEADQADGAIDHTALLAGVDGNRRVLRELVRLFLADCPRRLAEIKEAIRRGDAGALGRAAHTLKGSVGNFAAKSAFAAAQRLEIMSGDIDLENVDKACVTLESELALLSEELRKLTMNSSIRKTKTDKRGGQKGGHAGTAEGITEVRRQEALLKTGALQNAILNSANFSSIATDEKGVIQIFNVGAERMLGYTVADVLNKITPADISDPQEVIARAKALSLELGTTIRPGFEALVFKASRGIEDIYELTYIRKDGSRFPAVVSVTALRDAQNVVIGYLLIGTDNTARKQAEEALLKAGALQSAIFNSANFSSIATDAKGVIQIFNVGAERMLGYAAADVMNKITPAEISDPQEVIARAKALSVELSTTITPGFEALVFKASRGIEDIYELTYIRKDGSRFPAVVSVTALRDAQNVVIGYLLIGTDNTARKQVEEEQKKLDQRLRDQQFYTRSLIESNIDALMTTDPSGIITDVNKQMEALTGCTRDELIGAPFKNYFTDPERAEAGIKLVLSQKKVTNYELTASARDGKKTVVSYNATTFYDRDRKLQGVFAAARDVTERKRFEVALQETNVELESAKSAAEKANLAKSDFLSSMSHELRSPLNAILGFAQLLESTSPLPTASQKENIAQILQAGWHLLKLINEVLDLAVVESGKMSLSPESVSLAEVISECQAMMEPQAKQRGISMTFPQLDIPYYVHADRTRVKQVLINLLSNAIKYNREQGTVEVKCTTTSPERIRISVKDTGAGLAPEKLTQLFQPFNRLGQESRAGEGTGIGLVMSKRVVELMEGAIGVESTVGVGSVFWIELLLTTAPTFLVASPESTTAIQARIPTAARLRTLLYVEDNPANLTLVEQLIARRSDIRLLTAVNGTLGIEIARASQPEVILMDINLPGISGIEALKILREDPATAHIPVVALSANAMQRDTKKGMEAGFFYYLTKPIKVNEFMDVLDGALEFAEKNSARN